MSGFFNKLFGHPEPSPSNPTPNSGNRNSSDPVPGGRPFLVSELASLLPPEFVRLQGVDVNRIVSLNLDTARRTLAEGRPAVMLSEIFQACPEIFPRAVTSHDDFEVRLPISRVRSLLGEEAPLSTGISHAPEADAPAPVGSSAQTASPFRAVFPAADSPFQAATPSSPASPFQVATPATASPIQAVEAPVVPPAPALLASPFEVLAPTSRESAGPDGVPATERVARMAPADGRGEIKFDLADSLKAISADILGFSLQQLPAGIECKVPASKVRAGTFPGTGMVALRDVVAALPAAYRSVFGACRLDHELVIPCRSTAPAPIPDESIPEPVELLTAPVKVSAHPASPAAPVLETPFAVLAREETTLAPPAQEPVIPSVVPVIEKPAPEPLAPLAPIASAPAMPAPVEAKPDAQPAPVSRPAPPAPGDDDDLTLDSGQLELRAIFGLSRVLAPDEVFALATGLDKVKAAAYFAGDKLVYGSAPEGISLEAMPAAFRHLVRMTRELGISDARTLTIQTERGLLAFFSEGDDCLAVLHEGRRFAHGLRERLVIILRELIRR
jgi:hypothetical protein